MAHIIVGVGALTVTVQIDNEHPDALEDAKNRAQALFTHALTEAVKNKLDIMTVNLVDAGYEDDLDDE